jgi:hypothetical protein
MYKNKGGKIPSVCSTIYILAILPGRHLWFGNPQGQQGHTPSTKDHQTRIYTIYIHPIHPNRIGKKDFLQNPSRGDYKSNGISISPIRSSTSSFFFEFSQMERKKSNE